VPALTLTMESTMSKAALVSPPTRVTAITQDVTEPLSFEYRGANKVLISIKTATGEKVSLLMNSRTFMATVRAASACMNSRLSHVLTDIGFHYMIRATAAVEQTAAI